MSRAIESYEQAYSTEDESQIPRLIREAFSSDAVFESPYIDGPIHGVDALVEHVRATRDRIEGVASRRTSPLGRVGQSICWTWALEADGATVAEGIDFVLLDEDGQIQRFVVFAGVIPADRP